VNGKAERWGIFREDGLPFTVAAIYDLNVIDGQQVRSMSMLNINADDHPFMSQILAMKPLLVLFMSTVYQ
jgi:hypothetical protein